MIVVAAPFHADTFYCLSAIGELYSHTIRSELFDQIVPHHYDDITPRIVEAAIYNRDMNAAYDGVIKVARTEREIGQLTAKHEQALIEVCTVKKRISDLDWQIAREKDVDDQEMIRNFCKDLDIYGYGLPPGFSDFPQWTQVSSLV